MYKAKQRLATILTACFAVLVSMLLALALWNPTANITASAAETTTEMSIFANKGSLSGTTISWKSTDEIITFKNEKTSSSNAIRTSV